MSLVALAPFPAFNPLNWWALVTPANAAKAALHNTHMALDAWRAGADSMRAMMREQQDALFRLLEHPEQKDVDAPLPAAAKREAADAAAAAAEFVHPMVEVTRAYGRIGKAFIVAQRDTMRAFASSPDESRPN
ncbi:MAG: hypothetical protein JNK94_07425 [Hyphomonadaceae bacterium]|nr:hypothetical protein [Hyphomonadaceae bacterium]